MTTLSILKLPEVKKRTGKSRSSIYSDITKGTFPKQVRTGSRSSGWLESEINQWIENRIIERDSEVTQ